MTASTSWPARCAGARTPRTGCSTPSRWPGTAPGSSPWSPPRSVRRPIAPPSAAPLRSCALGEVREGLWARPANLPRAAAPAEAWAVVDAQCSWWTGLAAGRRRRPWSSACSRPAAWAARARTLTERLAGGHGRVGGTASTARRASTWRAASWSAPRPCSTCDAIRCSPTCCSAPVGRPRTSGTATGATSDVYPLGGRGVPALRAARGRPAHDGHVVRPVRSPNGGASRTCCALVARLGCSLPSAF